MSEGEHPNPQRRDALLWAADALPMVHKASWIKVSSVLYWLRSWAEGRPAEPTREVTDEEFAAALEKMRPNIERMNADPAWSDEAFAARARAFIEPVEDVLAEHQPSETPGRCSCGFWLVTRIADHQAAMLRGEGFLERQL